EFDDASYAERFQIFFERMVRERLLDAACLILGRREDGAVRFASDTLSGNVNSDWPHRARLFWPRLFGVVGWSEAGRSWCRFR
ncbi:MAG: PaeR7I family type II restriction endonuclease, partial [Actinobacteria bacterium]|nr:PaeR7I family type II restriction endonuclease [Actinomycetota bacterium]